MKRKAKAVRAWAIVETKGGKRKIVDVLIDTTRRELLDCGLSKEESVVRVEIREVKK